MKEMNHLTVFTFTPNDAPPPGGYVGYLNVAASEDGTVRLLVRNRGNPRLYASDPPFADEAYIYLPHSEARRLAMALFEWPFDHKERPVERPRPLTQQELEELTREPETVDQIIADASAKLRAEIKEIFAKSAARSSQETR